MPIPAILDGKLNLPVIGSPMFIVSTPDLVIAQCKAGVVGSFPALNARPKEQFALWLERITSELAAYQAANPQMKVAPFAVNQIVHASNDRLMHDMETCVRFKVPIIITSLRPPGEIIAAAHSYGGIVLAGAISNGASVLAAQVMGADLAYMGTRFIAVKEANASEDYKQMILKSAAEDIVYTALFSGIHGNYLKHSVLETGLDPENLPPRDKNKMNFGSAEGGARKAWRDIWSAGQGVGQIDDVPSTDGLVARLRREYDAAHAPNAGIPRPASAMSFDMDQVVFGLTPIGPNQPAPDNVQDRSTTRRNREMNGYRSEQNQQAAMRTHVPATASSTIAPPRSTRRGVIVRAALAAATLAPLLLALAPREAQALPAFARQTGQNCVACHAGGQFPELTPYGRMFKMTGYTIGQRALPLSMMGVVSASRVSNTSKSDNPPADFQKQGAPIFATGSLFIAGKVTENLGLFSQITYDNYAAQGVASDGVGAGEFKGHTNADNIDLRYADRFIDANRDLIVGVSMNNNPSVSDPWNTAAAWMQYVPVPSPTSSAFVDGNAPYPGYGAGGNVAGLSAYAYLNKSFYAELGGYRTANGGLSFMSAGINNAGTTKLKGLNPYWRLAYTHEWGPNNIMVGASGMTADVYDNPEDISDPSSIHHFEDQGFDAQYQYLLDPHTVTAQLAYLTEKHRYPDSVANQAVSFVDAAGNPLANTSTSDTTHTLRAKLTYTYQAKYGGSLGYFNRTGSTNTLNQTSGYDPTTGLITSDPTGALGATAVSTRVSGNLSGNPATSGFTYEAFWTPVQYVRVGLQYTSYSKFNGASSNYDGLGRDAKDNNTLFLYVWGAY